MEEKPEGFYSHSWMKLEKEVLEEYRDIHTEPKTVGVGTYARHIPNTLAFGIQAPWQTDQCHQANEHVAETDFLQWIQIIKEFIIDVGRCFLSGLSQDE